jgi:hypothetical protein
MGASWQREVLVFGASERALLLPAECASCGAAPACSRLERGPVMRELFVPYCEACDTRLSRQTTRALAMAVASLLCAGAFGSIGPLLWPWASAAALLAASTLAGVLPLALAYALERRAPSHALRALWWRRNAGLVCERVAYARELERLNGVTAAIERVRPLGHWGWAVLGIALGALCSLLAYRWHHPRLHALNLNEQRLFLWVDGRALAELAPSSFESPDAGVVLRVPAGHRQLELRSAAGTPVASTRVVLERGVEHLYASASDDHCFWLERVGYGRQSSRQIERLTAADRFWALRDGVDTWFVPPPPASADRRSSGGVLRALRYARCEAVPEP